MVLGSKRRRVFLLLVICICNVLWARDKGPVKRGRHLILQFSDRGIPYLSKIALRIHGFDVLHIKAPRRPKYLDPKWEKVFVTEYFLEQVNSFSTITWMDDDFFPDISFLRKIVHHKNPPSLVAGFEYGRRKENVMTNFMVFFKGAKTTYLVRRWAATHMRYLNKTTGLQDQDGFNELYKCYSNEILCVTHSWESIHTSGRSAERINIINRAALVDIWRSLRANEKIFSFFFTIAILRRDSMKTFRRQHNKYSINGFFLPVIVSLLSLKLLEDIVPGSKSFGGFPDAECRGYGNVRRIGDSGIALSGRWLFVKGALVWADWLNRHQVLCIPIRFGFRIAKVLVYFIERKKIASIVLQLLCSCYSGLFFAYILLRLENEKVT